MSNRVHVPRSHTGRELVPQSVSSRKVDENEGSVGRNSGQEMQALGFAGILGRVLGFPQVVRKKQAPKLRGLSDPS